MAKPPPSASASPIMPPVAAAAAAPMPAAKTVFPAPDPAPQLDPVIDAAGETTPTPLPPDDAALMAAQARSDAAMNAAIASRQDRLSPPMAGPRAMPLPAVQMVGTKGSATPDLRGVDPLFDRRSTVERLLTHPDAEVRQRAQEAQVAIHHGAADIGVKVRAAIDTAKAREVTR